MNFLSEVCFLCLNKYKILNSVSNPDNDGIVVADKLKCCMSELINLKPEIPKNICNNCLQNLNSFYIFKMACLRNNATLNVYLQHLTTATEAYKQLTDAENDEKTTNAAQIPNKIEEQPVEKEKNVEIIEEIKKTSPEFDIVIKTEPDEKTEETPDTQFNYQFVNMCEPVLNEPDNSSSSNDSKTSTSTSLPKSTSESTSENTNQTENKNTSSSDKTEKQSTGKKSFTCPICDEIFYSKNILVYHLQSHAEIRNFKCLYCSKTFLQKSHLIQHTETHTGIKDFECARCGKKFGRKSSLIEHEKIHTGVKDYECTLCNKQFLLKKNLVRHMKNTHPEIKDFSV